MLYNQSPQIDKENNFQDFNHPGTHDLINLMGNLDLNRNNDNIFNSNQNDDNQHSLNQAFNQLNQPFREFWKSNSK